MEFSLASVVVGRVTETADTSYWEILQSFIGVWTYMHNVLKQEPCEYVLYLILIKGN